MTYSPKLHIGGTVSSVNISIDGSTIIQIQIEGGESVQGCLSSAQPLRAGNIWPHSAGIGDDGDGDYDVDDGVADDGDGDGDDDHMIW